MVDFKKLIEEKSQTKVIDPIEIFRRLPKPSGINDIYTSQEQVLREWFQRRNEKDIVIKLHTGGGKTLVGLLIAQSIMNELHEPVLYLCPTIQLVNQIVGKSIEYGIPSVAYEKGKQGLPKAFLAANSVLIGTYETLFNGKSKFGISGQGRDLINTGAIIFDDAHVAYAKVREAFTIRVDKNSLKPSFDYLTNIFRKDIENIGRLGLFDDTISGKERFSVIEVPYWSWKNHLHEVYEHLRKLPEDHFLFTWPLLRDSFNYCHVFITENSFVITPYFPLVDLIPTFESCKRRIYMSATIADDSSIIRTFNASVESVSKPISSNSLAGVGERMILFPEWMKIQNDPVTTAKEVINWTAKVNKKGTIILVPSAYLAAGWQDVGTDAKGNEEVQESIRQLKTGESAGPFIFENRYDGIDLPDEMCRLLIFANMPRGTSEYESYLSSIFEGSSVNNSLAQKIEQGIGRASRGSNDYCVILLLGNDVLSWIVRPQNERFLTRITRAQLSIGIEISQSISNFDELIETIQKCFSRNEDWIKYHAQTLADLTSVDSVDHTILEYAQIEQKAFRLWRDGYYDKAINILEKYCESSEHIDNDAKGWLYQFAARIASFHDETRQYEDLQQKAFSENRNLFRPQIKYKYSQIAKPYPQAIAIVDQLNKYQYKRGVISKLDQISSNLIPEATSNQFEQAMMDLGALLGFSAERPEKSYGVGPDILWVVNSNKGYIIEAKSRKKNENPYNKDDHGQLLVAEQWFKTQYPDFTSIRVAIHPNKKTTENAIINATKVITYESLYALVTTFRSFLGELSELVLSREELISECSKLLDKYNLNTDKIENNYLEDFIE
jgi:Superfamily II helicase